MAIGLTVPKPLAELCRSLCTLVGKSMHAKVMAVFQTQKPAWCTHLISIYLGRCIKYTQLVNSCKLYGNQADSFYAENA